VTIIHPIQHKTSQRHFSQSIITTEHTKTKTTKAQTTRTKWWHGLLLCKTSTKNQDVHCLLNLNLVASHKALNQWHHYIPHYVAGISSENDSGIMLIKHVLSHRSIQILTHDQLCRTIWPICLAVTNNHISTLDITVLWQTQIPKPNLEYLTATLTKP